ncbi:GAF domain-containing protein [Cnuibacter physcomitrellae]|uniref:sensor histidine kinase n=1 Tax=Cnuibacter physcomitrellae TaxID=1619308 RepID=UPI002175D1B0|nr:GAF domain-containing protein [Cnuibacter physcomitrellae]MCS5497020.1 GAF domain-containing protein [Cnuibacter physcomitrellae]
MSDETSLDPHGHGPRSPGIGGRSQHRRPDAGTRAHDVVDRAEQVLRAQERLRSLLRASAAVSAEIDLTAVLQQIVDSAAELVDAEYAALGVISPTGGLESFIHTGMSADLVARIGHLPEGHGLLGAVIEEASPIRLDDLASDPRSSGFPAHHPDMHGFLGVPVRVGDTVYGNLYLGNRRGGGFSAEDEELVSALAVTAGNAIRNARLFRETHLRERWMRVTARLTPMLLGAEEDDALGLIVDELFAESGAERVVLLVPGPDPLTVRVAAVRGVGEDALLDEVVPAASTVAGIVLESGESRLSVGGRLSGPADPLALVSDGEIGATVFVPFTTRDRTWGVLGIARAPRAGQYGEVERTVVSDVAARLSLALELARAREAEQRGLLLEDRARIARDLHDHVIQLLFATGLDLHNLAARPHDPAETALLEQSISRLDESITKIRTIVFAINPPAQHGAPLARHLLVDLAAEASKLVPRSVDVAFAGPVDIIITGELLNDVTAAAREMLSNVVRHARATTVDLSVTVGETRIDVAVRDDGVGFDTTRRSGGLKNLGDRAHARGGDVSVTSAPGATTVRWTVPVP